jgi:hypothetical protein
MNWEGYGSERSWPCIPSKVGKLIPDYTVTAQKIILLRLTALRTSNFTPFEEFSFGI